MIKQEGKEVVVASDLRGTGYFWCPGGRSRFENNSEFTSQLQYVGFHALFDGC